MGGAMAVVCFCAAQAGSQGGGGRLLFAALTDSLRCECSHFGPVQATSVAPLNGDLEGMSHGSQRQPEAQGLRLSPWGRRVGKWGLQQMGSTPCPRGSSYYPVPGSRTTWADIPVFKEKPNIQIFMCDLLIFKCWQRYRNFFKKNHGSNQIHLQAIVLSLSPP